MTFERPARLRAHHLICLRFFHGEGYSESFVANLEGVLERARRGGVVVADGADEVCVACPGLSAGVCTWDEGSEAEIRRIDALASRLLGVAASDVVDWAHGERDVLEALPEWTTGACVVCGWRSVCADAVAKAIADRRLPE